MGGDGVVNGAQLPLEILKQVWALGLNACLIAAQAGQDGVRLQDGVRVDNGAQIMLCSFGASFYSPHITVLVLPMH